MAILWPFSPGIRLVFPLVPWTVFLAVTGLRDLSEKFAPRHTSTALYALVLLIAIPFIHAYRHTDFGPIRQSDGSPEFNQLCQAVRERTTPHDVLIYFRARALALYTGRRASAYNPLGTNEEFWQYAQSIQATYLVTSTAVDEERGFLARFAQQHPSVLELTFQNNSFCLYRIVSDAGYLTASTDR